MEEKNDVKLEVILEVNDRKTLGRVMKLSLGTFDSVRQAEKIRQRLSAANPNYLFLAVYCERFINLQDL